MRCIQAFLAFWFLFLGAAHAGDLHFPIDTVNETLNYIAIDTSDIAFRTDWVERDSFRLKIVDELTLQPLRIPNYLKSRGDFLRDPTVSVLEKFDSLAMTLNNSWMPIDTGSVLTPLADTLLASIKRGEAVAELKYRVFLLLAAMQGWYQYRYWGVGAVKRAELAFVRDSFSMFMREEEKDVDRPLNEIDSIQKLQDSLAVRFKEVGPRVSLARMIRVSRTVVAAYVSLVEWLWREKQVLINLRSQDLSPGLSWERRSSIGAAALGGKGDDHWKGGCDVIIDLGGDDEYVLPSGGVTPCQVIIDMGGNDRYIADSDYALAAGHLGCGILDDWQGNDTYIAKNYSLGCGIFGTGILVDRGGDDTYIGDIGCQGASSFGIGMLLDYGGRDSYSASLYSQGFAFIMGASALVDYGGNDRYAAGWKYGDILRYEDHYVSLSQGFAYGLRPHFSGGVGLLVDGGGNDTYNADIFGQGGSYWWGLGGLIDYGGNDQYLAYQYAQGSGTHLTLGALIDIAGDDLYSSKGVSQGCGHDLAYGLLLDCAGNDQYNAFDLSQAAGSANGVGMLIDLAGDDAYMARVKTNTHGYGNPRREFGSVGLLLDLAGRDDYRGYGSDDSYWVTQSKWGIGADLNSTKPDTAKVNVK